MIDFYDNSFSMIGYYDNTVKPHYINTIGKQELWRFNEFGDSLRFKILSAKC